MTRYRFDAAIQPSNGWGTFVIFPHDTQTEFRIKGRVPVQALLGCLPYTGSLMPFGPGYHRLSVPQTIREQLGKQAGDLIHVELWKDDALRTVHVPEEFTALLKTGKLLSKFEHLNLARRKEYRNWITSAKREETRLHRMEKAIEILRAEIKTGDIAQRPRLRNNKARLTEG